MASLSDVDASEHLTDLPSAPGELLAIDLPPGPQWAPLLRRLWEAGVAFMPLDHRLTSAERRAVVDRARPAALLDPAGVTLFPGDPIGLEVGAVVATSGTAGAPKLVELTRDGLTSALETSLQVLRIDRGEPWIACLSPAHVGGLLVVLRGAVFDTPVSYERFDRERSLTQARAGSHVSIVPPMAARMADESEDLSALGILLVGGGHLDPDTREALEDRGAHVVTTYGLTETAGGVVYDGVPFPTTKVLVREPENRILVSGPTVMEGYRNDPSATGSAFTVEGWLRTADAGRLTDDGRLHVDGRLDDAIRTGAETVWPAEVERVLRTHPDVADVAVSGRPDPEWGQHVVAFVVPRDPGDPPTLEGLRDHVRERLARHKAPRELVLVEAIPRTPGGKIRRSPL